MHYIISENNVYESTPPFSQVGEITEGTITILTLNEMEEPVGRTRRGRIPKARTEGLDPSGDAGGVSEKLIPEAS